MTAETMVKLLEVRDEFAQAYQKPAGRFVSLGFSVEDGKPCLKVLVDGRFDTSDLPDHFRGIAVHVRESRPAVLAVGSV